MSMTRCDQCDRSIDSDYDPECFVDAPWRVSASVIWCESCRADNLPDDSIPTWLTFHQ